MHGQCEDNLPLERVLEAADKLFSSRGYAAVTLRDIGHALGVSHASLYYHFPGGKESLFVKVMERNMLRHGQALQDRLDSTRGDIRLALNLVAQWLLSQPPLDLIRMSRSDMPEIEPADARRLMDLIHAQLLLRLQQRLQEADEEGQIHCANPALMAGVLIGMLESFHSMPPFAVRGSMEAMAGEIIDILLRGMGYRGDTGANKGEES